MALNTEMVFEKCRMALRLSGLRVEQEDICRPDKA